MKIVVNKTEEIIEGLELVTNHTVLTEKDRIFKYIPDLIDRKGYWEEMAQEPVAWMKLYKEQSALTIKQTLRYRFSFKKFNNE